MLKLIKEVLRVGNATVPYPFVPVEVAPGFRGKPEYDPDQCIACAACVIACPPNALNMETDLEVGHAHLVDLLWTLYLLRAL